MCAASFSLAMAGLTGLAGLLQSEAGLHVAPRQFASASALEVAPTAFEAQRTGVARGQPSGLYGRLVPVFPQGLGSPPYPPGTVIDPNAGAIQFRSAPQYVWFEIRLGGWGTLPGSPELRTWQLDVDVDSMGAAWSGGVSPAQVPCAGDPAPCQQVIGPDSTCIQAGNTRCANAYVDTSRPDWLEMGIAVCNTTSCGGTTFPIEDTLADDGGEYYGGTIALQLQPSTLGNIQLRLAVSSFATMEDSQLLIPFETLVPATIYLHQGCCTPNGTCTPLDAGPCIPGTGALVAACLGDCNNNAIDDGCEFSAALDCNANFGLDECDIAEGRSDDCAGDGIPDECQGGDCNTNAIMDLCDISSGSSVDSNGNQLPDECEQTASRHFLLKPAALVSDDAMYAIRVKLVDLAGFSNFNGQVRWVGAPQTFPDVPVGEFPVSPLVCQPHFQTWTSVPMLHVYGASVTARSTFEVQVGDVECLLSGEEACLNAPLEVHTLVLGDIVEPFASSNQLPNFLDVSTAVSKFRGLESTISLPRTDVYPNTPDHVVNFLDVSAIVDSFKGLPYPFSGPTPCW